MVRLEVEEVTVITPGGMQLLCATADAEMLTKLIDAFEVTKK